VKTGRFFCGVPNAALFGERGFAGMGLQYHNISQTSAQLYQIKKQRLFVHSPLAPRHLPFATRHSSLVIINDGLHRQKQPHQRALGRHSFFAAVDDGDAIRAARERT